jgi:hypothetical protein
VDTGVIGGGEPPLLPFEFDWQRPDYQRILVLRAQRLNRIRRTPGAVEQLRAFYVTHPIQFIIDWGFTFDPRNIGTPYPALFPFVPFPRQVQMLEWILARWKAGERGIIEKSRGSGASWLSIALSCTLCLFNSGMVIGFGSRKQEYVDNSTDPKSLFFKARMFLELLPPEFVNGWRRDRHAPHMRIMFPGSESAITGECGDGIGRGDRTSITFVDEAAFLEHPELTEGSLSDTTNCRIDISTSAGRNNVFFDRREQLFPRGQVFSFGWVHDPRRDIAWYEKKLTENAEIIIKREYGDRLGNICYDEGGEFFLEKHLLVDGLPVDFPIYIDSVYAVVDTAIKTGKQHDGLAVAYYGLAKLLHKEGALSYALVLLDWDLTQIEGASLEVWLPGVFQYLETLAGECKARLGSMGAYIEDKGSGTVLLQQAANKGWNAQAIESRLTAMGKEERAINCGGYVYQGLVKMSRRAFERTVSFKGINKNHFLAQVLGFSIGQKEAGRADDSLDTFTYGLMLALGNQEGF